MPVSEQPTDKINFDDDDDQAEAFDDARRRLLSAAAADLFIAAARAWRAPALKTSRPPKAPPRPRGR